MLLAAVHFLRICKAWFNAPGDLLPKISVVYILKFMWQSIQSQHFFLLPRLILNPALKRSMLINNTSSIRLDHVSSQAYVVELSILLWLKEGFIFLCLNISSFFKVNYSALNSMFSYALSLSLWLGQVENCIAFIARLPRTFSIRSSQLKILSAKCWW